MSAFGNSEEAEPTSHFDRPPTVCSQPALCSLLMTFKAEIHFGSFPPILESEVQKLVPTSSMTGLTPRLLATLGALTSCTS
jgi:hypothetical protein